MSRSVAQPSPALAASATSQISADAVSRTFRIVVRPVVRLALRAGLKLAQLEEILRDCIFLEGQSLCGAAEAGNASRLSVITGLHRKAVAARLAEPRETAAADERAARQTLVARVFSRWAHEVRMSPRAKTLPIANDPHGGKSFSSVAASVVNDVHPRTVLDELIRLGFVSESDGRVTLLSENFSPKGAADDQLSLFTRNAAAMLDTGAENVLGSRPAQLEYAIGTKNISHEDAAKIAAIAAKHWKETRDALYQAICDAPEVSRDSTDACELRVGTYVNYRLQNVPETAFNPAPASSRQRRTPKS